MYEINPETQQHYSEREVRFQETVRNLRRMEKQDFDQVMRIVKQMQKGRDVTSFVRNNQ